MKKYDDSVQGEKIITLFKGDKLIHGHRISQHSGLKYRIRGLIEGVPEEEQDFRVYVVERPCYFEDFIHMMKSNMLRILQYEEGLDMEAYENRKKQYQEWISNRIPLQQVEFKRYKEEETRIKLIDGLCNAIVKENYAKKLDKALESLHEVRPLLEELLSGVKVIDEYDANEYVQQIIEELREKDKSLMQEKMEREELRRKEREEFRSKQQRLDGSDTI